MAISLHKILLPFLFFLVIIIGESSAQDDQYRQWCVADEQTPDDDLQAAMNWACQQGGADCSSIQENQSCYWPNNVKDHASVVFNKYYQKFKSQGGSCYFGGAAIITELDPSHDGCHFDYLP